MCRVSCVCVFVCLCVQSVSVSHVSMCTSGELVCISRAHVRIQEPGVHTRANMHI